MQIMLLITVPQYLVNVDEELLWLKAKQGC